MDNRKVEKALIGAFNKAELDRVVRLTGKRLDVVSGGDNLEEIIFNLVDRSDREGWLYKLVLTAALENSGNQELRKLINSEWNERESARVADVSTTEGMRVNEEHLRTRIVDLEKTLYGSRGKPGMVQKVDEIWEIVSEYRKTPEWSHWLQWVAIITILASIWIVR